MSAGRMLKHSSIYAIGNISRQLVGFIMLPIYTRYLTPADYGVIGLLTFAISLIDILFGARLVQAVPKFYHGEKDPKIQKTVISTALIFTSAISALTAFVIIYFSTPSSSLIFGSSDYSNVLAVYSILILTQAIENYGLLYIRIKQRPFLFLAFNLSKLAVQLGLNIWLLIVLKMGVMGIAISAASASILFATILLGYTLVHTRINWDMVIAKKLIIFSWPLWLAGFAGLYFGSANRYYMRIFSSLDDVGLYELGAKFAAIISLLIWKPFSQYWQTERFKIYNENPNPKPVFQAVFLSIGAILIISGMGISLLSEPAIYLMATSEYSGAAKAIPILVMAAIIYCFTAFLNFSQLVTDHTGWISKNNYFTALIATIFFLLFIPPFGFVGAATGYLFAVITQFLLTAVASRKHYDMNLSFRPIVAMFVIACATYLFNRYGYKPDSIALDILYKVFLLLVGSAMIMMILIHNLPNRDLMNKIMNRLKKQKPPLD